AQNTNTRTQCTTRPTQTDADMNINGLHIFTRSYNNASTASQPSAFAIQIGKGMKGTSLGLYKNVGKSIVGAIEFDAFLYTTSGAGTSRSTGVSMTNYDENTGVYYIDAGYHYDIRVVLSVLKFSDLTTQ